MTDRVAMYILRTLLALTAIGLAIAVAAHLVGGRLAAAAFVAAYLVWVHSEARITARTPTQSAAETRTLVPYAVTRVTTALAAAYGWRRIAAQEREDFDWRSELLAQEYWHFERRDGLSWYGAVSQIYDDKTLKRLFSAEALKAAGVREQSIPRLGLPWAPPPVSIRGEWVQRPR